MKKNVYSLGAISLLSFPLLAVDYLPSSQAFTGLILTPNAQVSSKGVAGFTFAKGQPFRGTIAELDSLNFNFGLLKGLETSGRIVTREYDSNCFTDGCGIRDLSASFKYQLPSLLPRLDFAIGVQDLGGAVNHYDAYYVVADYEFESFPLRTSFGYGSAEISLGVLDGPFGGVEYQPLSFLQLVGEYDSREINTSVRLMTPDGLLPYGASASFGYQLSSGHENVDQEMWFTHFQMQMARTINKPYQLKDHLSRRDRLLVEQAKSGSASISALIQALKEEGFLNIRLGTKSGSLIVTLENRRYDNNQVDGLGVALGIISSYFSATTATELGLSSDKFKLISLVNEVPVVAVSAKASEYRLFLKDAVPAQSLRFSTQGLSGELKDVAWHSQKQNSGFGRAQVILSPAIRYAVATDYGVWDYSLALAANLYSPLWKGAALDLRYLSPVSNSDDYKDGYWEDSAFRSEVDRILIHQTVELPFNIYSQFSAGLVMGLYHGVMNESQWFSDSGAHSFNLELSHFSHEDKYDRRGRENVDKGSRLIGYTYSKPDWNWQFNLLGGEFWHGDKGAKVKSSHWFGDTAISVYYHRTKYENLEDEQFVGIEVSLPINPWRGMTPGRVQLKGTEEFSSGVATRVGDTLNFLGEGQGVNINLQHSMKRQYLNRGRFGTGYFENQLNRLRNAYLKTL